MSNKIEAPTPSQEAAYQQGREARARGLNIPKNPFVSDTPNDLAPFWFRGWSSENSDIMDRIRDKST